MKRIVILISGRGSNLQSLLAADLPGQVVAVISNRADAAGLQIARSRQVPIAVIPHQDFPDRESFDAALSKEIDQHAPDFVVLAGFMRILTRDFVEHYRGRLINIHPSLLPAFPGLNTHQRALDEGMKLHGCTVHFVTADLDHGPIIIQAAVPVLSDDTVQTLSARVLHEEHRIYPQALRWICRDQVWLDEHGKIASNRLEQPGASLISPGLE